MSICHPWVIIFTQPPNFWTHFMLFGMIFNLMTLRFWHPSENAVHQLQITFLPLASTVKYVVHLCVYFPNPSDDCHWAVGSCNSPSPKPLPAPIFCPDAVEGKDADRSDGRPCSNNPYRGFSERKISFTLIQETLKRGFCWYWWKFIYLIPEKGDCWIPECVLRSWLSDKQPRTILLLNGTDTISRSQTRPWAFKSGEQPLWTCLQMQRHSSDLPNNSLWSSDNNSRRSLFILSKFSNRQASLWINNFTSLPTPQPSATSALAFSISKAIKRTNVSVPPICCAFQWFQFPLHLNWDSLVYLKSTRTFVTPPHKSNDPWKISLFQLP